MKIELQKSIPKNKANKILDELIALSSKIIEFELYKNDKNVEDWNKTINKKISLLFNNHKDILTDLFTGGYFEFALEIQKTVTPDKIDGAIKDRVSNNKKILVDQRKKILTIKQSVLAIKDEISLKNSQLSYDNKKSKLAIETTQSKNQIKVPAGSIEHYLYKAIFKYPPDTLIAWDEIAEEILGEELDFSDKNRAKKYKKKIKDVIGRANDRIKKELNTKHNLLSWSNKSVKRNY